MGQLCQKCRRALRELLCRLSELCSNWAYKARELLARICECCCLWPGARTRNGSLYRPVLQQHEKRAAREFLRHLEKGERPAESVAGISVLCFGERGESREGY
ncbi:hypothetical protein NDU88_007526 [Pleurodeles waltl]|uniref:Uncharacterized protein n=1 Tax=Pleurodeles waltl TaxID=8319 RepID=A0AAV7RV17_PLEWA|nr:hypothetical protein NDU88_007526 [Pleurodeles waltl]